jgi:hypothetical protein
VQKWRNDRTDPALFWGRQTDRHVVLLPYRLSGDISHRSSHLDVKIAVGRHNLDYTWFGMFWLKGGSLKEPGSK